MLPIADVCEAHLDSLQYKFFGHKGVRILTADLCDPEESPIGIALDAHWNLLESWSPEASGPWVLLHLIGWKDFQNEDVRLLARREVLVCSVGIFVQFDCKYVAYPARLHKLVSPKSSEGEKAEERHAVVNAPPCCKSAFVQPLLQRFPTEAALSSGAACATLRLADMGRLFATKLSEMGHAAERIDLSNNGPGKPFVHHARRDMIRRERNVHIAGGGDDPCGDGWWRKQRAKEMADRLGALKSPSFPRLLADAAREAENISFDFGKPMAAALAAATDPTLSIAGVAPPSLPAAAGSLDGGPPQKKSRRAAVSEVVPLPFGSGGSVYLTFLNHSRRSYKHPVGGRKVAVEEQRKIEADCRAQWSSMSQAAKQGCALKFKASVQRRLQQQQDKAPLPQPSSASSSGIGSFASNFGTGARASMNKPNLFCAAFQRNGFPKDDQVFQDDSFAIRRHETLHSGAFEDTNIENSCCGARLRNVCKDELRKEGGATLVQQQQVKHRGLCRLMDSFGKAACNRAEILLMLETKAPDGSYKRVFALVAQATMSPKSQVFCLCERSRCNKTFGADAQLSYPFDIYLSSGTSRVCPRKRSPSFATSDEFATMLARMSSTWSAFRCRYTLLVVDNLLTMRVTLSEALALFADAGRAARGKHIANAALDDLRELAGVPSNAGPLTGGTSSASRVGRPAHAALSDQGATPTVDLTESVEGEDQPQEESGVDMDVAYDEEEQVEDLESSSSISVEEEANSVGEALANSGGDESDEDEQLVSTCQAPDDLVEGPSPLGYYMHKELGRQPHSKPTLGSNATSMVGDAPWRWRRGNCPSPRH